jgi:predicted nucleic acid-binding Zn ribbon protein
MLIVCLHCGKTFEGNNEKFCSNDCRDAHITSIEKRVIDATENDHSHTKKLSKD